MINSKLIATFLIFLSVVGTSAIAREIVGVDSQGQAKVANALKACMDLNQNYRESFGSKEENDALAQRCAADRSGCETAVKYISSIGKQVPDSLANCKSQFAGLIRIDGKKADYCEPGGMLHETLTRRCRYSNSICTSDSDCK